MIVIRRAVISDISVIVSFNQKIAYITEGLVLDAEIVTKGVQRVLEDATKGFYVIADIEGSIAGSLLVTFEWSDWQAKDFWWIQSVFVSGEFRKRGVYRELYTYVKKLGIEEGAANDLRLYVEHDNEIAKAAYSKLGMKPSHYLIYSADLKES